MSQAKRVAELELKIKRQAGKIHALIQKNKKLKRILENKNAEFNEHILNNKRIRKTTSLSRVIKKIGDKNG